MASMFEDILVICSDDANWSRALAYASSLAAPCRARLTALPRPGQPAPDIATNLRDQIVHCRAAPADAIGFHAAWADVLVIDSACAGAGLESVVVDSARPCIVLPDAAPLHAPRRIAVGWNGSLESMRALKAVLPLLRAAGQVVLLDAGVCAHEHCSAPPCAMSYLVEHGVVATHVRSGGDMATAARRIVDLAAAHGADLLVLGAWRHRRFSDWDTGAVVTQALQSAAIPVLLAH